MRLPHAATVVGGSRVNGKDTSGQPPRSPGKQCIPQVEPEACNELKAAQDGKGGQLRRCPGKCPKRGAGCCCYYYYYYDRWHALAKTRTAIIFPPPLTPSLTRHRSMS